MQQSVGSQTVGYNLATEQQNKRGTAFIYHMALCLPDSTGCKAHSHPGLQLSHCSCFFGVGQEYAVNHSTDGWAHSQSHTPSPDLHATGHLWS